MSVTPSQFDLVSKILDATALRQKVLGQNVANVNTPGFKRQEVAFEEQLRNAIEHDSGQTQDFQLTVSATQGLESRTDGNNVDIDLEMGQLTRNELVFETYTQILATHLSMIRSAISGRS